MKLFASGFSFRLDELNIDGYSTDYDAIMRSLEKYRSRENGKRFETTLPEYNKLIQRYSADFSTLECHGKHKMECVAGDRNLCPTGGLLEEVFEKTKLYHAGSSIMTSTIGLFNSWARAHVNEIINQIYSLNLPTIDNFLLLNNGCINDAIEWIYGGRNDPDAEIHYPAALLAKQNELGRELTDYEIIKIRCRFYKTSDDQLEQYKQTFIKEVREEWDSFMDYGASNMIYELRGTRI